jgi:flagellar biosynthetic protein FliR
MMLLAVALLFLMNAHVAFVQTISETFAALPPGGALLAASSIELLSSLIAESLRLALQVAAPVLAALSIAEVALGFLGQTVPQINVLILGFPIRVLLGLIVFALIQPAAMDLLLARLPEALSALGAALSGLGGD